MDLSIVSQFMSLTPDMMYKATKMVETVQSYFPGDVDAQEQYLNENLIDQTLDYALTLLEDKKVRDYMGTSVYTNGTTFSAPTLALYNVPSLPEMKKRIQAKLNARGNNANVRREEVELQERKMSKAAHKKAARAGKRWQDSDCDGKWYEPGEDVKKTRKEAVDYVADLWRNRQLQEDETVYEAMRDGPRQRRLAAKQYQTYGVTTRDRANLHNIAVRGDGPGTPGYEKKSTGGKGPRYAGYGDQGAGNRARRRAGLEPLRGNRDPRNEEFTIEAKNKEGKEKGADGIACWKNYKYAGTENGKDKCVKMEDVAEIATAYFMNEGLNEYGIDILIEEMGLDDFCDFVTEISDEYLLNEARTLLGKKKSPATGKTRGISLKAAPGKTTKAAVEKYGTTRRLSGPSSSGTIKKVARKQPPTNSTPTQTAEKSKGGILGALKARAQRDIASVGQSVQTLRKVGARRAAEVSATYDAVRAKGREAEDKTRSTFKALRAAGREAEQSKKATSARRKATVRLGRTAQDAGRFAIKAAGAAGAARGQAEVARRSGATVAQALGRGVGTFVKRMKKEERELLTHYFIESEIAFNYDEVQEIFETLDQEHFDYFMEQAMLMVEESGPSAREIIEETLYNTFDIERFHFADWRQLTEKKSDDDATGKFVNLTQTNRTDNTPDVKGKRKDGVIINPQVDMRREEFEQIDEVSPPGAKFKRMAKHIKAGYAKDGLTEKEKAIAFATSWKQYKNQQKEQADPEAAKSAAQSQQRMKAQQQMQRKQLMLQQQRLQMQKQGKLPTGHAMEEVEHIDETKLGYAAQKLAASKTGAAKSVLQKMANKQIFSSDADLQKQKSMKMRKQQAQQRREREPEEDHPSLSARERNPSMR